MSQQTIFSETHLNHYLFSDHYLNDILPKLDVWQETLELLPAKEAIQKLFIKVRADLTHSNEAQLEREFIQPILKLLDHCFEIQAPLHGAQLMRPDYTFFRTESDRKNAKKLQGKKDYFESALAIGDAKTWDRPLDRRIQKSKRIDDYSNPSVQINNYLIATSQKWGILTNGRLWRLYNKNTSFSLDSYYQVDLVKLIEQDASDAFKYFYFLFRRQAFEAFDTQPSFLDFVLNQSESYKVELEKDVKTRIYESLRILANGFLHYPKNNLNPSKDKQIIHDNCLILLYRMLFVFYAEARQLLPDHPDYKTNFSFENLKKQILEKKKRKENISPITTEYWGKLQALFLLLNDPHEMYQMPQYNGGLFNPNNYPFLERYQIGDQAMAEAFELVACAKTKNDYGFVDYRTLDVQHLGSIYEGLLEYKLELADQDKIVIKKSKKQELIANKADYPDLPIAYKQGEYYLVTDKGERKATGSYYTPDYIVRYIVENTLQPLVDKCNNYEQILKLNILDPAMGSGHFLVGVVDFLAEQILYHPTTPLLEEGEEEKEIAHWRRRIVERCIYGVDINPLAVELAKLSLWLHTVAFGKPLSFLDHHLRCGNSLIGAQIKDLHDLPVVKNKKSASKIIAEQITIFENRFLQQVKLAVGHYLLIEQMETRIKGDIDRKEQLLKIAEEHLQQFKKIANVWTSAYFGNDVTKNNYQLLLDSLQDKSFNEVESLPFFQRAQEIAAQKRFFHWEMEFPDIFFDNYGRWLDWPGFDGVVGNPPYISVESVIKDISDYYNIAFSFAYGRTNSFALFIEEMSKLLWDQGTCGVIVSNRILSNTHLLFLRQYLLEKTKIKRILSFKESVFPAAIDTTVIIFQKSINPLDNIIQIKYDIDNWYNEQYSINEISQKTFFENTNRVFNLRQNENYQNIITKIKIQSQNLEEICKVKDGIILGSIKDIILSNIPKDARYKKWLEGHEVSRYGINWEERYICYDKSLIDIELERKYKKAIQKSATASDFKKIARPGIWLRDPEIFYQPKVLTRQNTKKLIGVYDDENYFVKNSLHCILRKTKKYELKYILGLINSSLLDFYFENQIGSTGEIFSQMKIAYIRKLPIKVIDISNKKENDLIYEIINNVDKILNLKKKKQNEIKKYKDWLIQSTNLSEKEISSIHFDFCSNFSENDFLKILKEKGFLPSPNQLAEITKYFEQLFSVLDPLLTQIQETDWLIDQIVYRLYGLTEEEIRIVEESLKS